MNIEKLNKSEDKIIPIKSRKIYIDTANLPELKNAMIKRG